MPAAPQKASAWLWFIRPEQPPSAAESRSPLLPSGEQQLTKASAAGCRYSAATSAGPHASLAKYATKLGAAVVGTAVFVGAADVGNCVVGAAVGDCGSTGEGGGGDTGKIRNIQRGAFKASVSPHSCVSKQEPSYSSTGTHKPPQMQPQCAALPTAQPVHTTHLCKGGRGCEHRAVCGTSGAPLQTLVRTSSCMRGFR